VHAVIEAYGDRMAAADVVSVVGQYTGNAAVMQPELETVVGSQQLTATSDAAFENMRLDFTLRFDDITVSGDLAAVRATSQGTITIRATGETQLARLRHSFVVDAGAVEGAAPASSESATRIRERSASACGRRARRGAGGHADLPARTGAVQVDVGVAGAVRVPALGVAGAAGGHGLAGSGCWLASNQRYARSGSRPPRH
jgi:ketosteroid isomerase-like protein